MALCRIKGKEKIWKPWVENRVVSNRKVSDRNTADIPTRMNNFESFQRWFIGPEFFHCENFDNKKRLNVEGEVVSRVFIEQKALFVGLTETKEFDYSSERSSSWKNL